MIMHRYQLPLASVTIALFQILGVVGAPSALDTREVECTNTKADYDPSCWQKLGVTEYLKQWSPPVCQSDNTTNCCPSGKEWSTCFLKLGLGPGFNCTTIASGTCEFDNKLESGLDPSIQGQVRYVLKNILCR